MRFLVLATDFDNTITHPDGVRKETLQALERVVGSGRKLVLVTGRELPDLLEFFPQIDLFEYVVAENGALLYRPATKEETLLSEQPPLQLVDRLRLRGVKPMSVGQGIIGTWEPHQHTALEVIRECGLEWQIIFNKGAVMLLPAGVNKAFGLSAALDRMELSPHNVVGIGDAENDHAFLSICEVGAAVANALPAVKRHSDLVTKAEYGDGLVELIDALTADDLAAYRPQFTRHDLKLGEQDGRVVTLPAYGSTLLVCGASGSGKSTVVAGIIESLVESKYQFCLVDPEGDYEAIEGAMALGGPGRLPNQEEILDLLQETISNAIADLTGLPIPERPAFFLELLPRLLQMRTRVARPHWLVFEEAHHLMPSDWRPTSDALPENLHSTMLVTVHPDLLSAAVLAQVDSLVAVGETAWDTVEEFCQAANVPMPQRGKRALTKGQVLYWRLHDDGGPLVVTPYPSKTERLRHRRKFVEGELPPDQSFYFRGRDQKLNLRALNLANFLLLAEGVDDDTWDFHRLRHDYSQWFREAMSDDTLAKAVEPIEADNDLTPADSRAQLRAVVQQRYDIADPCPVDLPGTV